MLLGHFSTKTQLQPQRSAAVSGNKRLQKLMSSCDLFIFFSSQNIKNCSWKRESNPRHFHLINPNHTFNQSLPDETCLHVCHCSRTAFIRQVVLMTIPCQELESEGRASAGFPWRWPMGLLHGRTEGLPSTRPSPLWEGNNKRQTNTNKQNALKEEIRGFHLGGEQSCALENGKAANLKLKK